MCSLRHVIVIGVLLIPAPSSAAAQIASAPDRATVTVRAEGVPIATLLSELALVYPLEKLQIQRAVEQRAVWIVLEDVPPDIALVRILQASGLHFGVSGRRVIVGEWTGPAGAIPASEEARRSTPGTGVATAPEREARQRASEQEAEQQAAERAAEAATMQAISDAAGDETTVVRVPPVRFIANGENITYLEPNFVPYKMRPHIRALRMAIDVATIP